MSVTINMYCRVKPSGVMIPTHLKVLTIVERPFIYIRNKTFGELCDEEEGWEECPEYVFHNNNTRPTNSGTYKTRKSLKFHNHRNIETIKTLTISVRVLGLLTERRIKKDKTFF